MSPDPLLARVHAIVAAVAGPRRCPPAAGPDTPLTDGGYWLDSVDLLEVLLACDAEFDGVFKGEWTTLADALQTVGSLARAVRARLGP